MKKSRFTGEQIIGFIKQVEAGMLVKEVCRKGGFSDATFYKWRAKFGGMDVPDARRLRELAVPWLPIGSEDRQRPGIHQPSLHAVGAEPWHPAHPDRAGAAYAERLHR